MIYCSDTCGEKWKNGWLKYFFVSISVGEVFIIRCEVELEREKGPGLVGVLIVRCDLGSLRPSRPKRAPSI